MWLLYPQPAILGVSTSERSEECQKANPRSACAAKKAALAAGNGSGWDLGGAGELRRVCRVPHLSRPLGLGRLQNHSTARARKCAGGFAKRMKPTSGLVLWLRRKSTKILLDFIVMAIIVLVSAALLVWLFLP